MAYENWLTSWEKDGVIEMLLRFGLLKYDNKRSLPLKSGGKTDIYINLRNARNNQDALSFLAEIFSNPLRRLGVTRFVEIPDSVSCIAGPLAITAGMPYLTVREQAKSGRATKAKTIGDPQYGERVCIIDDVITDGASKIAPFNECRALGLDVESLVVLVDRQQGWKNALMAMTLVNGKPVDVWAGMTLHDVRRYLVRKGIMERCSRELEDKNPLIIALDGKSWEDILPLIDQLRTTGCILKVNDLVFAEGINTIVPNLQVYGRVMVDLKSHDIPNTVANTCKHLRPFNPWAVTVHATGGSEMVKAAVKALEGTDTKVLAVTVLTSIDPATCDEIYSRQPFDQVEKLVVMALKAGAHGIVCSPEEVGRLKPVFPGNLIYVTPGIRSEGAKVDDQKRISTPAGALTNGSNYLVMGRQILGAKDPFAEVMRLMTQEIKAVPS